MPPQCPPIPPHPAHKAGTAMPAPDLPQATTGMPQPPVELRKHLRVRVTTFTEVLNPREGGVMGTASRGSAQGPEPQTSSISH